MITMFKKKIKTPDDARLFLIHEDIEAGNLEEITTPELEWWINQNQVHDSELVILAKFELQKRQISTTIIAMGQSAKWAKWMTIATGIMAGATIVLAIITYYKP